MVLLSSLRNKSKFNEICMKPPNKKSLKRKSNGSMRIINNSSVSDIAFSILASLEPYMIKQLKKTAIK